MVQRSVSILVTVVLLFMVVAPVGAATRDHVLPMAELSEDVNVAKQAREANISTVQRLLKTEQAQQLLRNAKLDSQKAQQAVTLLDDQELSQLADRAAQVENDIAAGLTRGQTSLLLLAGAVIVIIIVIAAVA